MVYGTGKRVKMQPKPKHLGPQYGAQFQDEAVVAAYGRRPPYPDETFTILSGLVQGAPRRVLDVGCGTGYVARPLAPLVDSIDAIDLSRPMLAQARQLPGGDAANIRWLYGAAETAELTPPYALITAGESLHWLDWSVALPRFAALLTPGGYLAIVGKRYSDVPWGAELGQLINRYSTNREYAPYNIFTELTERGLFVPQGEQETAPITFRQPVSAYVESFHSRNGFSRQRMDPAAAEEFDTAVTHLALSHHPEGFFEMQVTGHIVWGYPQKVEML